MQATTNKPAKEDRTLPRGSRLSDAELLVCSATATNLTNRAKASTQLDLRDERAFDFENNDEQQERASAMGRGRQQAPVPQACMAASSMAAATMTAVVAAALTAAGEPSDAR